MATVTVGSRAFKALGVASSVWVTRLAAEGVERTAQTIDAWKAGRRSPEEGAAILIHEKWDGPSPQDWRTPIPSAPASPSAPPPPLEPVTPEAVADEAATLLQHVRTLQRRLTDVSAQEAAELPAQIRMAESISSVISRLGQVSGSRITERAILASPHWAELEAVMVRALEPWPDAMRAVADALEARRPAAGGSP